MYDIYISAMSALKLLSNDSMTIFFFQIDIDLKKKKDIQKYLSRQESENRKGKLKSVAFKWLNGGSLRVLQ